MNTPRLCPECYVEMKPIYDREGKLLYYQCPKCGKLILFTHSGH
ncbi:zf-TFIIB domain-containing protein [Candidatus Bathycorpusculum sp.]|nr:60S ribosomal export protein NMD3 [Candidatus Termitimicrobium sp.]MCL2685409.1 60S ribosomal export protein NMD3 [Candidatus Termitimicrobium sp.]